MSIWLSYLAPLPQHLDNFFMLLAGLIQDQVIVVSDGKKGSPDPPYQLLGDAPESGMWQGPSVCTRRAPLSSPPAAPGRSAQKAQGKATGMLQPWRRRRIRVSLFGSFLGIFVGVSGIITPKNPTLSGHQKSLEDAICWDVLH